MRVKVKSLTKSYLIYAANEKQAVNMIKQKLYDTKPDNQCLEINIISVTVPITV